MTGKWVWQNVFIKKMKLFLFDSLKTEFKWHIGVEKDSIHFTEEICNVVLMCETIWWKLMDEEGDGVEFLGRQKRGRPQTWWKDEVDEDWMKESGNIGVNRASG